MQMFLDRRILLSLALGLSVSSAWARKTSFLEKHSGLMFGAGTFVSASKYDIVPELAPDGTRVSGTSSYRLIPAKFGYFVNPGPLGAEVYFRGIFNTKSNWKSTGGNPRSGETTFRSYGAGLNIGYAAILSPYFQLRICGSLEYVMQRATLNAKTSDGKSEELLARASTAMVGGGIQPELWLGDLWVLSLFAGYQYGIPASWKAGEDTRFFGNARAGTLRDADGKAIGGGVGGILVEAALKLNFY